MRTINPKCSKSELMKYSILISLYFFDLKHHLERIKPLLPYADKYDFTSSECVSFENNNPNISLSVYDEMGDILHKASTSTNSKAYIVKINDHRYHAIKPSKDKHIKLKELLNHFIHKELVQYIVDKVTQ